MTKRVPDIVLERYRLHELPDASTRAIDAMVAADPELRARLEALDISDDEIRRQQRAQVFVHDVPAPSRRTVTRFAVAAAVALAAVVLAIVLAIPRTTPPAGDEPGERVKGTTGARPSLTLYRRTAAGSERLADGVVLRAGDLVRVGYASGGRPFGVILSIDGRGAVTMHLPAAGDRAVALQSGSKILLDAAYELDDAPRLERFYFITGADAFAAAPVLNAARQAGRNPAALPATLPLPGSLEQVTFAIQKEDRK